MTKASLPSRTLLNSLLLTLIFLLFSGCDDAKELIDIALDPPSRKPIDQTKVGVNNFFVNREFGSISDQFLEIRDTLGIKYVRVLFAWTGDVQSSPDAEPNYAFYDEIVESIPPNLDVVVVLAHTPYWMVDPKNWISDNPRYTWVVRWLRPTVERYANIPGIVGFEVWNEPDLTVVPSDAVLSLDVPENYLQLLNFASNSIRDSAPSKLIVLAATQSIQQNFPTNLRYNKTLRDLGAENLIDIWNIHYYSTSYESVVTSNGVADFLNGLTKPIWLTESGKTGPNSQLAYVETTWPFLIDEVPTIERTYYYEYGNTAPAQDNYGLRTTDPAFPVSDLYIYLRDN